MTGRRRAEVRSSEGQAGRIWPLLRRWPSSVEGSVVENPASWRGLLWTAYIATMYYLLSNPLVLIGAIEVSILLGSWATILVLLVERQRLRLPVVPWSVLLFTALGALSFFWSISKDDTWSTARLTFVIAGLALLVTSNVSAKVLAYGIAVGGAVIMCLSMMAFWMEMPGAVMPYDVIPTVAGVGTNRNILAYTLVPALAAVCAIRPTARWEWPAVLVLFAANAWGIWVATSGTGYLAGALVVLAAIGLRVAVASRRLAGPWGTGGMLALMAVGAVTAAINLDSLARFVGRDLDTLSGRRPLWSAISDIAEPRIMQGYGFGAVWNHPWHAADANDVLIDLSVRAGFSYPHGHNSFMDLLLELGLLACIALALIYLQSIARAVRALLTTFTPGSLEASRLVLLLCLGHLASGLSEPLATVPFGWYVLVLAAGISLQLGSARLRQPPAARVGDPAAVEPQHPREAAGAAPRA